MKERIDVVQRLKTTEDMFMALTGEPLTDLPIRDVRERVQYLIDASREMAEWMANQKIDIKRGFTRATLPESEAVALRIYGNLQTAIELCTPEEPQ